MAKICSETDAAYIAGFFDGEGCVSAHIAKKSQMRIAIGQKNPQILHWIQETLGYGTVRRNSADKEFYHFTVTTKADIQRFIHFIYPYAKGKKVQLDLMLQLIKLPRQQRGPLAIALSEAKHG